MDKEKKTYRTSDVYEASAIAVADKDPERLEVVPGTDLRINFVFSAEAIFVGKAFYDNQLMQDPNRYAQKLKMLKRMIYDVKRGKKI